MYSSEAPASLYVVQVRHGNSYREHVGSCEFREFYGAKDCAVRLDRWLKQGHFYDLSDEAESLPDDLAALGIDPRACVVEVVRLQATGPNRYETEGEVLCVASCVDREDTEDDAADEVDLGRTPLEPEACARTARLALVLAELR